MTNPADSFFGGAPGISWPGPVRQADGSQAYADRALLGVIRGGVIVEEPVVTDRTEMGTGKPLTFADGSPKQQMIVTLVCDGTRGGARDERDRANPMDQGKRKLYIKGYMIAAFREAGITKLHVGGELYVAWTGEKPSETRGYAPARLYAAKYTPPTTPLPEGGAQTQPAAGQGANPWGNAAPAQQPAAPTPQPAVQPPATQAPAGNPFGQPAVTGPPAAEQSAAPPQNVNPWG
jgi:hypothetical protein